MSESDDEYELSKAQLKAASSEHKKIFMYERVFMWANTGDLDFGGPDEETAASFLLFAADPSRFVIGSGSDAQLRQRLNCLQTETIFAARFRAIRDEAHSRLNDKKHAASLSCFKGDSAVEVFALWFHH